MALKKQPDLAEALAAITEAAPGLRASGVTRVAVGDIAVDLAPAAAPERASRTEEREPDLGSVEDWRRREGDGGAS